jgi:nitrate reductase gamma subunit
MFDLILFVMVPYAALLLAVVATVRRLRGGRFSLSSLSSQFLEGRELFYGSVPWHYGILAVLTGHLIGFLCPRQVLWFNSEPLRLYILETTGLMFGLLALAGIVSLLVRRITSAKVRVVTSTMDIVVLVLLLTQVTLGVYMAIFYRWGSSWYAASLVPYLRSLLIFQPDVTTIAPLPLVVKLHILNFYLMAGLLPFSRLIHLLLPPLTYLWRPYELVIWNRDRKKVRTRKSEPQPEESITTSNGSGVEHHREPLILR